MRSSWQERIFNALVVGVILFMLECVANKLFAGKENWLSYSLIISISWAIGLFISKTITNMNGSIWKILGNDLLIIFLSFIILAFVLGVVCDMANWGEIVFNIIAPFSLSMIINNQWKRD